MGHTGIGENMKKVILRLIAFLSIALCLQSCMKQESHNAQQTLHTDANPQPINPAQPMQQPVPQQVSPQQAANSGIHQGPTPEKAIVSTEMVQFAAQTKPTDSETQPGFLGKIFNIAQEAQTVVTPQSVINTPSNFQELPFYVKNVSGSTLYVTCFAYIKPRVFQHWRWRKSIVKELKPGEEKLIKIKILNDEIDKPSIFGFLGVFTSQQEAEESTYELLRDENKLDLDQLAFIENKTVIIGVEKYGIREPFYDYDFIDTTKVADPELHLDFFVKNETGKTTFLTCFVYLKKAKGDWIPAAEGKDDMSSWRFYKTKVIRLANGQVGYINVDNIVSKRDWGMARGYLAIFDEAHEQDAHNKTYELLSAQEKISLGLLSSHQGKTVILDVESYGVANDVINFTIKPIRWIDFGKIIK